MEFNTSLPAQATGENGYIVKPIFTIGETISDTTGALNETSAGDYAPPGILDGLGAYELDDNTVRVFANHELLNFRGYEYEVSDGAGGSFAMAGARVSYFDIDKESLKIIDSGLAYNTIYDANGEIATDISFLANDHIGFSRFCSSVLVEAYQFGDGRGLEDRIYFSGEEDGGSFNGVGGAEWALDTETGELWQVPAFGRGAWENVTEVDTGTTDRVAFVLADDSSPFDFDGDGTDEPVPTYLYVGTKNPDGDFLDRNGLRDGKLYVWVSDTGETSPTDFNTSGSLNGSWVEIDNAPVTDDALKSEDGSTGFDEYGYPTQSNLVSQAEAAGAFGFSRPEDVAVNPENGTQVVLASTGVDTFEVDPSTGNGVDTFGTMYTFDIDFSDIDNPTASLNILYDGDADPSRALRSPDNLDWADDGFIYVQEDEAEEQTLSGDEVLFGEGAANPNEAGIVKIDPTTGDITRVANIDRSVSVDPSLENPFDAVDVDAGNAGEWETSGILDVSTLFGKEAGSLFLFDIQAHGLEDQTDFNPDSRLVDEDLAEGGQLAFLKAPPQSSLTGFASLPADTFAEGPPSGSDNGDGEPIDANGRTGPFDGQPVQGFSGVQFAPGSDGSTLWFLSDNGFGAKTNSSDYLLRLYQVDPNFVGSEGGDGSVEVQGFVQLSDPDNLIPFDIQNEGTADRPLTGSDFDIESFTIDANGDIWVGDEFGPYMLHFDAEGKLLEAPIPTPNITNFNSLDGSAPLVIGHRGASGALPEHTLEAYQLAMQQGADFVEPDLVITKDGVLIARHEPILDDTTNVADVFGPERMSTKFLDGEEVTAYFAEDFTLAEIKQLRAVQSRDYRSPEFDGIYEIPTLQEVIELVQQFEADTGKQVGIYPETKHPTFFDEQGLSLEEPLIETLQATGFTDPNRIFIQSFELQNLIELKADLAAAGLESLPLVQLFGDVESEFINDGGGGFSVPYDFVANAGKSEEELRAIYGDLVDLVDFSTQPTYADLFNQEAIDVISTYADGLGPWKNSFVLREPLDEPVDGDGDGIAEITTQLTGEIRPLVDYAHNSGLQVHPYTLRNEERFLTLKADGTAQTAEEEFVQLTQIGVDGFFTDFPKTGAEVVGRMTAATVLSPDNPDVLNGPADPNLPRSRGYEGMAFSPDRQTLYPMLEGTVEGDPEGSLRIYEFDVPSSSFEGLVGLYQLDDPGHAIGDFTPINTDEFLVIERDGSQGEEAEFKKIFKVNLSVVNNDGFVVKQELVNLLDIADPNDLNSDGESTFDFPFVTIEDVLVLDEKTLLVANDNNYPFSQGRDPVEIDNNEIIQIELEHPLDLDPRLGVAGIDNYGFTNTQFDTSEPAQMEGLEGYEVDPLFTIGETYGGYTPTGILDGLGAYELDDNTVRVLANSELRSSLGYAYELANGTELTGARVQYFDIDKDSKTVVDAGLAYDTIINRQGEVVDEAADLDFEGINRLCSAQYIAAHQFGDGIGLEDDLFFTGEEAGGGTEFVLDPATNTLHAVPWMGRAAWESVTELNTGTTDKVAMLIGDDRGGAPLLMYVGTKNTASDDVLKRNGLVGGDLYVWVADSGETSPEEFNGTGESRDGSWVAIDFYEPGLADTASDSNGDGSIQDELGYDADGFATQAQQDALAEAAGAFKFSRPEDVATNPNDGTQAVLASTGRDSLFPADSWGTTYIVDTQFDANGTPLSANINAIYDGDDAGAGQFAGPDYGLRSPDNLEWADDGSIYLQEDRSFGEFGLTSNEEASIWKLDPTNGELERVAQMDRSAVPSGQTDNDPEDIGDWESSGIIDVSDLFGEEPGELFLFDVQAHSLRDGVIESENLVQGGQLAFLSAPSSDDPLLGSDVDGTLVGSAGVEDIFELTEGTNSTIVDFTFGEDKFDISNFSQVALSFDGAVTEIVGSGETVASLESSLDLHSQLLTDLFGGDTPASFILA